MVDHVIRTDATADEILAMDKQMIELKAKRIFWVRMAVVVVVSAVIIVIAAFMYVVLSIRDTQLNGTPTGKAILETNEQIKSCVTTQGACYKRGQAQQTEIIRSFTDRTVFAVACGQRMPDAPVRQVLECVDDLIAGESRK